MDPLQQVRGVKAIELGHGEVLFEVAYRDELIGDPVKKAIHGGVSACLPTPRGGVAVWSVLDDARSRVSTIICASTTCCLASRRPARPATLVRAGKTVGVADVRLFHPSDPKATIARKGGYAIRLYKGPSLSA